MKYLEQFKQHLIDDGKAKNTVLTYLRSVAEYGRWYGETCGMELEQLYRTNVLDYISYLRTVKALSARSVNTKLSALISFNEFLIEEKFQQELVLSKKDLLRVQQQYANPSTLNKQQVEEFRQRVLVEHGKRDHAIVTILAYAGLRISECLNLKPEDVNLAAMEVRIQTGKGDKERVVYLNDKIANAIREYLAERPPGCPYLFISRKGGRLDRSAVNRIFNQCSDTITPHTLRHYFCSAAIEVGGYSMAEVANQAGHSNIHTTMLYTNPTREEMKRKANKL